MMNGNGKISDKSLTLSRFLHKGRWHYSSKSMFLDCETFNQMREMNITDEKIFKEFGKSFKEAELKSSIDYGKAHKYPDINNWQQLLDFMMTIMKDDVVKFIKSKITEDMKAESLIPLLPEAFQPIFRLRLDYDEKIKINKAKTMQELAGGIK